MKRRLKVTVDGKIYEVEVEEVGAQPSAVSVNRLTGAENKSTSQQSQVEDKVQPKTTGGEVIKAPIPGKVWKIVANTGDQVSAGDVVLILEAMKMENEIISPIDGEIKEMLVSEGKTVNTGDALVVIA